METLSLLNTDIKFVGAFALFSLIPFAVVMMTSFTRISIVLTFLKQALATSVPSMPIIIGLSLVLTGYVMHPVFSEINDKALRPYFAHEFKTDKGQSEEMVAIEKAWPPLQSFMLNHTREKDLNLFLDMANLTEAHIDSPASLPWYAVIPAFVVSELRVAFCLGFLLFLPFLVIDLIVTSLLMSMGMIMLPPVMISFPFKLLLFIMVDGWHLIVSQLVKGYEVPL